jgi:hypothetical protein
MTITHKNSFQLKVIDTLANGRLEITSWLENFLNICASDAIAFRRSIFADKKFSTRTYFDNLAAPNESNADTHG